MMKAAPDASIYSSTDLQLRFLTTTFLLGVLLATVLNSLTLTRLTGYLKGHPVFDKGEGEVR